MKLFVRLTILTSVLMIADSIADAAIVRFDFTGTVTSAFDNDPATDPDQIFGTPVTIGASVSGLFFLDDAAPQTDLITGLTGTVGQYDQNLPQGISATVGGLDFRSMDVFNSSVANDFTFEPGQQPFEAFAVSDGVSTGLPDITGENILVGGNVKSGRIGIQLNDNDATAFSSNALPNFLDLSDFEIAEGTLNGMEPSPVGGAPFFYQVVFSIDSLTVTQVPEPICDFNGDLACDVADINLLFSEGDLVAGTSPSDPKFDLSPVGSPDGILNAGDVDEWLDEAATENGHSSPYPRGDTDDLGSIFPNSRDVDITDFNTLSANFTPIGDGNPSNGPFWHQANFDGDDDVDITDFNSLSSNFAPGGYGPATGQIPEPTTIVQCMLGLVSAGLFARGNRLSD